MKERFLTKSLLAQFRGHLILEERSKATIEKYLRDVSAFAAYADGTEITKELVITYKTKLNRRMPNGTYGGVRGATC